jgi:hypothetical protein
VEQLEEEAQDAGVQSLPTFIIYKDGVKAATVIGSDITKVKKAVDEALLKGKKGDVVEDASKTGSKGVNFNETRNVTVILDEKSPKSVTSVVSPSVAVEENTLAQRAVVKVPELAPSSAKVVADMKKSTHALMLFDSSSAPSLSSFQSLVNDRNVKSLSLMNVQTDDEHINVEFNVKHSALPIVKLAYKGTVFRTFYNAAPSQVDKALTELLSL